MVSWFVGSVVCDTADCEVEEEVKEDGVDLLFLIAFNFFTTIVILRVYSYYLSKELDRMEKRIYKSLSLPKTIAQKEEPSSVRK